MFRITTIATVALCSVMMASAGQIQIGGMDGLTGAYISNGCSNPSGSCIQGSTGNSAEQNYDNVLFSGALNGAVAPTPYANYFQNASAPGAITDPNAHNNNGNSGVTFATINDGYTANGSNNVWGIASPFGGGIGAQNVMTIPVGVWAVTDVWTMINTELAYASSVNLGFRDVNITFNFGTSPNAAATPGDSVTLKLQNTNNSATPSGQIQNSVACSGIVTPVTGPCNGVTTPASGNTASGPTLLADFTTTGLPVSGGPSVTEFDDTVYSSAITSLGGPGGTPVSGSVVLNDQGFFFGDLNTPMILAPGYSNLNTYLVSIQISEVDSAHQGAVTALSAISIDSVPEPSTVFLFLTGLGGIGIARFRRGKAWNIGSV